MHCEHFKLTSSDVVAPIVRAFPFASIAVNGPVFPAVALVRLTFRDRPGRAGAVDFRLARSNAIVPLLTAGAAITVVAGPSAHVSPSWYTSCFPSPGSDRRRMAPTLNYLSLVLTGHLTMLGADGLTAQVRDLVADQGEAGWRFRELVPAVRESWMTAIVGYRVEIEAFDCTAKLSHEQKAADRPGILEGFDGSSGSLIHSLARSGGRPLNRTTIAADPCLGA